MVIDLPATKLEQWGGAERGLSVFPLFGSDRAERGGTSCTLQQTGSRDGHDILVQQECSCGAWLPPCLERVGVV